MSLVANLLQGLDLLLHPLPLLLILAGLLIGITMGSIPGMTATMTIAVLISFTFGMEPVEGMMLLLGIYGGALYAGSIPAILIRTPGTPAAAATVFDGFPLSQQGEAGRAIGIATVSSVVGGVISFVFLLTLSPQIAAIAIEFGSAEYFALALFGLTIIGSVSGDSLVKGLIAGLLGMLLATVGLDPMLAAPRFTFGFSVLTSGLQFIAIMIGIFGITEGFRRYVEGIEAVEVDQKVGNLVPDLATLREIGPTAVLSGIAGTFIGVIPGAGGDIASFVTYNEAKRWLSNATPSFGEGNVRGVAAAEAGNNSTLTLGIPGDAPTAILIGALMVHGIRPGPGLFQGEQALVYAIFIGFLLVYVGILVIGLVGARFWVKLIDFPPQYLWPVIFVLCVVGTLALRGNMLDIWVMLAAGLLGYLLRSEGFPLAPLVLGMILGPIAESSLRRSLAISNGSLDIFYQSEISLAIFVLTALSLLAPMVQRFLATTDSIDLSRG
jgi:putative tricarboxylic transport membrane protein